MESKEDFGFLEVAITFGLLEVLTGTVEDDKAAYRAG